MPMANRLRLSLPIVMFVVVIDPAEFDLEGADPFETIGKKLEGLPDNGYLEIRVSWIQRMKIENAQEIRIRGRRIDLAVEE